MQQDVAELCRRTLFPAEDLVLHFLIATQLHIPVQQGGVPLVMLQHVVWLRQVVEPSHFCQGACDT